MARPPHDRGYYLAIHCQKPLDRVAKRLFFQAKVLELLVSVVAQFD